MKRSQIEEMSKALAEILRQLRDVRHTQGVIIDSLDDAHAKLNKLDYEGCRHRKPVTGPNLPSLFKLNPEGGT